MFQNIPESFHWTYYLYIWLFGHTLYHTRSLKLGMKVLIGILKSSIRMIQRCCSRISSDHFIKHIEDQRIVIVLTDHICDNLTVIEIKDRVKIHFMPVLVLIIPFKFCDIREQFLILSFCCEISVQYVLCDKPGICRLSCTPVIGILDPFLTADPKHSFIICLDSVMMFMINVNLDRRDNPILPSFEYHLFTVIRKAPSPALL